MWILWVALAIVLFVLWKKFFKIPKYGESLLITGGIKTGKTQLAVYIVLHEYRKRKFSWWIGKRILSLLPFKKCKKLKDAPMPRVYANVPIWVKGGYIPLTEKLLRREENFIPHSVVYICEASLVADSMTYKDDLLNEQLLLFNKLFSHQLHGGLLVYDTQSISDNHYSVKRVLNSYFNIHHTVKVPFFCIMYVREMVYSADDNTVNSVNEDIEDTLKMVIVPKSVWRHYDRYCYSVLTDNLPRNEKVVKVGKFSRKKADKIVSFKKYKTINNKEEETKK